MNAPEFLCRENHPERWSKVPYPCVECERAFEVLSRRFHLIIRDRVRAVPWWHPTEAFVIHGGLNAR